MFNYLLFLFWDRTWQKLVRGEVAVSQKAAMRKKTQPSLDTLDSNAIDTEITTTTTTLIPFEFLAE